MMNRELMFSSKNQDWATPQHIFDELDKEFNFTLDPCCTEKTAKCSKFFTPKEDGLNVKGNAKQGTKTSLQKNIRRNIARIKTIMNERRLEQ